MSIRIIERPDGSRLVDVRLTAPDGRRIRRRKVSPCSSKSGTDTWARALELEVLEEVLHPRSALPEAPTLEEFATRFLTNYAEANRYHASGVASKRSILKHHLLPHLGPKRLDAITPEDVQRIKSALTHLSAKTVNNILSTLGKMLRIAVEWKVIGEAPCPVHLLPRPAKKRMHFHSPEEYERLVAKARELDPDTYLVVLLGGDAGLRIGEMTPLEWTDVDLEHGELWVTKAEWNGIVGTPKNGEEGIVVLSDRLHEALRRRQALNRRVLHHPDGRPFNQDRVHNLVERACRLAGLRTDRAVHTLRHSLCSHMAAVAPWRVVQAAARHRNAGTTEGYVHLGPNALRDAMRKTRGGFGTPEESENAKSLHHSS